MPSDQYRDCVVSFVDVLGFRDLLKSKPPEEIQSLILGVRESLSPKSDDADPGDKLGKMSSKPFGFSLSDAVVRIRPYDTKFRDGALFYEILDLMYAQADLINRGISFVVQ